MTAATKAPISLHRGSQCRARLAISVFNAEEVRAAITGGADIIDCEDPRAALGMFEPRVVTDIAYAVRQATAERVATSANIGVPQVVKRADHTRLALRQELEVQAKAAQEALGLAVAMDVGDAGPNVVKFEIDGLPVETISGFVGAVKRAIRNSRRYQNHRAVASFFELNWNAWRERRNHRSVISELLTLGEFYFHEQGAHDLRDFIPEKAQSLASRSRVSHTRVNLIEPTAPETVGLPEDPDKRLELLVRTLAGAGADGVMIDTPIQAKVAKISLLNEATLPPQTPPDTLANIGTFTLDQLRFVTDYCAYHAVESWLAGSIQPAHAAKLASLHALDVIMCRGAASAAVVNPLQGSATSNERATRRISEELVRALAEVIRGVDRHG